MDDVIRIGAAATALGVSIDTLRRWERRGRISFQRHGRQRYLTRDEFARLMRERVSVRPNRLHGIVVASALQGSLAEVELACGPYRVVSVMPGETAERLALRPGDRAVAVIEATTVAVERA